MVLTLKHGFPNLNTKLGRAAAKSLISCKDEWESSMSLVIKYKEVMVQADLRQILENSSPTKEHFLRGEKMGVHGRMGANIAHVISAICAVTGVDLTFGDFKATTDQPVQGNPI
ncbi:hypothetical protein BJX99DRAFT_264690 [Aspergillus californicus]